MSTTTRSSTPVAGAGAGQPTGAAAATGHFRYPGSLSFQDTELDRELFWGRRQEALEALHTILSSELTVLYGPSGIGKTSLLNAGVVQQLRARHYWPVSVRLNDPAKDPVVSIHEQIDEAAMRDTSVEVGVAPGCDEVVDRSLWDLLTCLEVWRGNDLEELVLVLDQFEELFTLGWAPEQQARFAASLGDVLRGRQRAPEPGSGAAASAGPPRVRLVIAMREDSLGHLETMAHDVPSIFDNRYRLQPLSVTGATAALVEPAAVDDDRLASRPFQYSEDAATGILAFLSSEASSLSPGGEGVVDPSQLQLVCQHVERAVVPTLIPPDAGGVVRVELSDLGGQAGLASILGEFYRRTVDSLPERRQRNVRRLCEQGLVSQRGRRLSLEQGEIEHDYQVPPEDLAQLVDRRLLRAEYRPRLRSHYYELAHDTLVEPILADRDARRLQAMSRRERLALAAAALVTVVAVVAVVLWQSLAGPEARPLAVGATLSGSLEQGDVPAVFYIDGSDQPTLVTVAPSRDGTTESWNPVVEVAVPPDGATTRHDRLGPGQAEQVVIVPARDEQARTRVAVTTLDGTAGAFDISREPVQPILLTGDGLPLDGAVTAPGETVLYVVDSSTTPLVDVEVTPIALGGAAPPPEAADAAPDPASTPSTETEAQQEAGTSTQLGVLELQVEIIGPDADRRTLDGQGQSLRTTVGGPEGRYYLVVRGTAASVGEFQITAVPLDAVLLSDGEPQDARLEAGSDALFAFTGRAGEVSAVRATPEAGFSPMLELVLPDGRTQEYGSMPGEPVAAVVSDIGGVYQARVSTWDGSGGAFTIVVGTTSAQPLALGESVTASGLEVFDVESPSGSSIRAVDVTPSTPQTLVEVATVDPYQGGLMHQVESQGGGTVSVPVTAEFPGTTRVVVLGTGLSEEYAVATREVDPTPLRVGETVTESGLSVFTVPAPGDQVLVIEVVPQDAQNSLQVAAYDANGFGQDGDFSLDGSPARVPLSGGYEPVRSVVVSASRPGEYTAQIRQVDPTPVGLGGFVETSELFSSFDVDVPPGQAATITVNSPMGAVVTVDGRPVDLGFDAGTGPTQVPVVGDGSPTRVLVRSWGLGEYAISVEPAELRTLDAADGLQVGGQIAEPGGSAIYELLLPGQAPIAVTADSEDFEVLLALFGPEGDQYLSDIPGQVQLGGFGPEGPHLLLVTGADDGTGLYRLTFASADR